MARVYVPIFFDWLEETQDLSQEEKGNLIDAVVSYAAGLEYDHLLTGGCRIAFRFIKGQVDRALQTSEARSKAGASKKEQATATDSKPEQTETNDSKPKQPGNKRFTPPTLDQVKAYCTQRQNGVDAQQFIDFYASKGWKVGNQPMKDWQAAVRTWEKRDQQSSRPAATVPAQQYHQRDYRDSPEEQNRKIKEQMERLIAMNGIQPDPHSETNTK